MEQAVIILSAFYLIFGLKMSFDAGKFKRKVYQEKSVDIKEAKSVATRIGIASLITGLSSGLLMVFLYLSTRTFNSQIIPILWSCIIMIMCTLLHVAGFLALFALKVSIYKSLFKDELIN